MLFTKLNLLFFLLFPIFSIFSTSYYHPLDPLSPFELTQVQTLVKNYFSLPPQNVSFHYVGLDEPEKSTVLSWQSSSDNQEIPSRRAFAIVRINSKKTHEIVIDLSNNLVLSDEVYDGYGYPLQNSAEQFAADKLAQSYLPFIAAIERRNLKLEEVVCMTFTVGWFGEEKSSRLVRVMCYYMDGTINLYMRPIEGITVTVDLDEMKIVGFRDRVMVLDEKKIVRFRDRVMVPVPKAEGTDYRELVQRKSLSD